MRSLEPDKISKLLIRGTNWVGDAVMSIPAMREIRRIFPAAHISLLVRPWVKDVYSAADFIDEVLIFDNTGIHKGWSGRRRLVDMLRQARFDAAVLFQNAFEAALIPWLAHIPIRIGYPRDGRGILLTHRCRPNPEIHRVHQVYYYLEILSSAGLLRPRLWKRAEYSPSIQIGLRPEDRIAAQQKLRAHGIERGQIVVGLNPGAFFGQAKRWLSDRYAKVADSLIERRGVRIVIFGSPGEKRIADEIAQQMSRRPVILAGQTALGELMGLIRECRLLITNDSGPMHLAAALDVPQLAIFGSTSEVATGPLSTRAEVINNTVDCSPCFRRTCPIDFRCMTRISVNRVLSAAEAMLKRESDP